MVPWSPYSLASPSSAPAQESLCRDFPGSSVLASLWVMSRPLTLQFLSPNWFSLLSSMHPPSPRRVTASCWILQLTRQDHPLPATQAKHLGTSAAICPAPAPVLKFCFPYLSSLLPPQSSPSAGTSAVASLKLPAYSDPFSPSSQVLFQMQTWS